MKCETVLGTLDATPKVPLRGEVCLACKVDTHALYAMKTLRKKDVLNRNQVILDGYLLGLR